MNKRLPLKRVSNGNVRWRPQLDETISGELQIAAKGAVKDGREEGIEFS